MCACLSVCLSACGGHLLTWLLSEGRAAEGGRHVLTHMPSRLPTCPPAHPPSPSFAHPLRRSKLSRLDCPHVWPPQALVETPTAGFIMRQHMACSLYDRLSSRPFLSNIEKVVVGGRGAEGGVTVSRA